MMESFPIPGDWDNRPPPRSVVTGRRAVVFRPDHKSFGQFILSDQMRDPVAEVALDISVVAKGYTPRSSGPGPHMQDQYNVVRNAGTMKVDRAFRVMVHVENTDPESALVEFGSKNNKRRRMLGRAGARFGDMKFKGKEGIG